jgi:AAA family ATP:ADP antiporter
VVQWLGVRRAVFIMPLIALGAYGTICALGSIALVRGAKITENASEYSVQNTVRQLLFLPTERAVKYKAKAAIDTFVVRAADSGSALMVWFGIHELGVDGRGLAAANIGLIAVWVIIALALARRYRTTQVATPRSAGQISDRVAGTSAVGGDAELCGVR